MAQKAKIEIQNTDKQGNQVEVAKKVPVEKAKQYVQSSTPKAARSVFSSGRGRRPAVGAGRGRRNNTGRRGNSPVSCFAVGSKGGPQDGSGPLGGTAACDLNQG